MRKSFILYTALGFMFILGVLHIIAQPLSLYWTYWWYDIMMHLLAGFSGGLVVLWFFGPSSTFKVVFLTIGCVLIVGIAWEVFEFVFDLRQPIDYGLDTLFDLINDILGAALAFLYVNVEILKSSLGFPDV
jgi:hypothetical protein